MYFFNNKCPISTYKLGCRKLTKFNSQAISSSIDITIADEPESSNPDRRLASLDDTSTPAYLRSCTLIGLFGGFGLDSFHISSTRLKSYK